MTNTFESLSEPLRRVVALLGLTSTDAHVRLVFDGLGIAPPDEVEGSQTVTTDENQLEFRFEDGVLVQFWVNPGSGYELPQGLQWEFTPEELHARLGPGEPLGLNKEEPDALQWELATDGARGSRLLLHMNIAGGFSLNGERAAP